MQINTKEFKSILTKINPAVPKNDDPDYNKKVMFTGNYIVTHGMKLITATPFNTDFRAVIPSNELSQIINKIKVGEIEFLFKEDILKIKSGKSTFKLKNDINSEQTLKDIDNIIREFKQAEWKASPNKFIPALKLCLKSVSTISKKIERLCIHFIDNRMESSDDFRISQYVMDQSMENDKADEFGWLVLGEPLNFISKFNIQCYSTNDTWFMCQDENDCYFAARLIDGVFGDSSQFFDFEGENITFPSDLREEIESCSIFSKGEKELEKEIRIELNNGQIILYSEKEIGSAKTIIDYPELNNNEPIVFNINPYFLLDILDQTDNMIKIGENRAVFQQDNFKHLISLSMV